jgi:hypothetical protein
VRDTATADVKLFIDLGQQTIEWRWAGDETEWKSALYAWLGNPVQLKKSEQALKTSTSLAGKIGSGLFHAVNRVTKPSEEFVRMKHQKQAEKD